MPTQRAQCMGSSLMNNGTSLTLDGAPPPREGARVGGARHWLGRAGRLPLGIVRTVVNVRSVYAPCVPDKTRRRAHPAKPSAEHKKSPCDTADSIHSSWSSSNVERARSASVWRPFSSLHGWPDPARNRSMPDQQDLHNWLVRTVEQARSPTQLAVRCVAG